MRYSFFYNHEKLEHIFNYYKKYGGEKNFHKVNFVQMIGASIH
jgi:hypothetical protein